MKRRALLTLALMLVAAPVLAQAQAQSKDDPVKITADNFVVDDQALTATFTGNVVMVRPDLTLWATKMVVDYGEGGPSNIRSLLATGKVRIKTPTQDATGDRAIYDPKTETLRLTGNVMVVNATGSVGGPDMLVDLRTNTTTFSGGRVTGVFTTE